MPGGALVMVARRVIPRVFFVHRMRVSVRVTVAVVAVGVNVMLVPT